MSDKISDEARAAIDAYLAKKKPTRLPTGMTSHSGYTYVDGKGLVLKDQKDNPHAKVSWHRKPGSLSPQVAQRRARLRDYMDKGMTSAQCAEKEGVNIQTIYNDAKAIDRNFPRPVKKEKAKAPSGPRQRPVENSRITTRREKVASLVADGLSRPDIAEALGVTVSTVNSDMTFLGLKVEKRKTKDKAVIKRDRACINGTAKVADRRRFKSAPVPFGTPSKLAPVGAQGTIFPDRVLEVADENVLKDGSNNSKIGGDVLLGWLEGARIYTLTLEERATCPKSCSLWSACYGNSMQFARRWAHGQPLMDKIEAELAELLIKHDRILVRLHVLGDFWSIEYAAFWRQMLDRHDGLHIFGFTAHKLRTPIGDEIHQTRQAHPTRYMIRHSDMTGPMGSFTLDFPTEMKTIGDAIVCPEQVDGMKNHPESRHCGNCAVCWSSDRPVAFVLH